MPVVHSPADYRQWAAGAMNPEGFQPNWPPDSSAQCVITMATGYPPDLLRPLVLSLRAHSAAHLVIGVNEGSGLEQAFAGQNVTIYPVKPASGYRPYPAFARIEYYLDILKGLPPHIRQILLVDSRDILFQADPFQSLPDADLVFFAENDDTAGWTLKTTNGRWAWAMLPSKMRANIIGKPIANGGVIYGTRDSIRTMCEAKIDIGLQTREWTKHTTGLDNISTNVVAHARLAGDCIVMANHTVVANIYRDTPAQIDSHGKIICDEIKPSPIVHMYDRKADLLARVNKMYGVSEHPDLVVNQVRSVGKASRFASLVHWAVLLRIYLTGKP